MKHMSVFSSNDGASRVALTSTLTNPDGNNSYMIPIITRQYYKYFKLSATSSWGGNSVSTTQITLDARYKVT